MQTFIYTSVVEWFGDVFIKEKHEMNKQTSNERDEAIFDALHEAALVVDECRTRASTDFGRYIRRYQLALKTLEDELFRFDGLPERGVDSTHWSYHPSHAKVAAANILADQALDLDTRISAACSVLLRGL